MPRLLSSLSLGRGNADLKKLCPAVPPTCADLKCQGDPTAGCTSGPANYGCPCTGPPAGISHSPVNSTAKVCPENYICSNENCQGPMNDSEARTCQNPASIGCPCIVEYPTPAKPSCPSAISCSDDSCHGLDAGISADVGLCVGVTLRGCSCRTDSPNPPAQGCPSSISKCSDGSCGGHLLDGSVLDGSNQLGVCSAASLHGCPCRDT